MHTEILSLLSQTLSPRHTHNLSPPAPYFLLPSLIIFAFLRWPLSPTFKLAQLALPRTPQTAHPYNNPSPSTYTHSTHKRILSLSPSLFQTRARTHTHHRHRCLDTLSFFLLFLSLACLKSSHSSTLCSICPFWAFASAKREREKRALSSSSLCVSLFLLFVFLASNRRILSVSLSSVKPLRMMLPLCLHLL